MSTDPTRSLKEAVQAIRGRRQEVRKSFEAEDRDLLQQEQAVEKALQALTRPKFTPATEKPTYSVSQERLDKVAAYLDKHPESRQSDIAKALELNGGSVHNALMLLQEAGKIRRGERVKKDGTTSRLWIKTEDGSPRRRKQKAA